MSVVSRRLLIFFTLLLFFNTSLKSQDCDAAFANLNWDFRIVTAPLVPGGSFFIECYVTGFTDVVAFQYSINYNPNVIQFASVNDTGSPLIGQVDGNFTQETQDMGSIGLIWTNGNSLPQTLDGTQAIFKLFFDVVGEPGDCSQFSINQQPVAIEVAIELADGSFCTETEEIDFQLSNPEVISQWLLNVIHQEQKEIEYLNIIFCSDDFLLNINQQYLNHDYYTDIITFDYSEETIQGELYISIDRVGENASDRNIDFEKELSRVLVHGVLHLCGYGDKSKAEVEEMREKEEFYLNT